MQNRGFGFITVKSHAEADLLCAKDIMIDKKRVDIYVAKSKQEILEGKETDRASKLFVGGLS